MGDLVALSVDADSTDFLVVEVDDTEPSGGLVLAAVPDPSEGIARARVTLEEALTRLKPSLQKIALTLKELAPEEAEVEFGLKIGGETGMIIAKGTAEVNFIVRMTWKANGPEDDATRTLTLGNQSSRSS
jgi:NTP-dependent ternary system trypsin peptidase co-occuring protein